MLMLIFITQMGYYGIFAMQQEIIRYQQKRELLSTLSNEELERIPWEPSMVFMDDNQEFSLNGNQYDIVRTGVEAGIRVYYAVNDKKETQLLKKLADASRSHGQQQGAKKGMLKISNLYCANYSMGCLPGAEPHLILRPVLPQHYGIAYHPKMVHPPDSPSPFLS